METIIYTTIAVVIAALLFFWLITWAAGNSDRQMENIMEADKEVRKLKTAVSGNISDLPGQLRYIYTGDEIPYDSHGGTGYPGDGGATTWGGTGGYIPEPPCRDCNRVMAWKFLNGTNWRVLCAMYGMGKTKFYDVVWETCCRINPIAAGMTIREIKRNRDKFFDFGGDE